MTGSKRVQRLIEQEKAKTRAQEAAGQVARGYARVSTQEQATKGHGIVSQENAIRAFAQSQGYTLLNVVRDPGVSGATQPAKRDGFRQVLELAHNKSFSVLLVWKIDRLARSIVHAVTIVHEMRQAYGVLLRSVTEPIDTATAMGQTIFAILAGMAQQERHVITERTLAGKKAKAARGGFVGATAPYGYRTDGKGSLEIKPVEADIIRRIFRMRDDGNTLQQIADWLNGQSVPTRRSGRWHPATVRYILDNPKYQGKIENFFRWQGDNTRVIRQGVHTPIIES